ncbi:MAG: hypothetical protein PHQ78_06850, partial [Candidatus Cloacimonetes bacterium]|nr:hypothetical protein [Candidatus Cloacimonadota bacterium]
DKNAYQGSQNQRYQGFVCSNYPVTRQDMSVVFLLDCHTPICLIIYQTVQKLYSSSGLSILEPDIIG